MTEGASNARLNVIDTRLARVSATEHPDRSHSACAPATGLETFAALQVPSCCRPAAFRSAAAPGALYPCSSGLIAVQKRKTSVAVGHVTVTIVEPLLSLAPTAVCGTAGSAAARATLCLTPGPGPGPTSARSAIATKHKRKVHYYGGRRSHSARARSCEAGRQQAACSCLATPIGELRPDGSTRWAVVTGVLHG